MRSVQYSSSRSSQNAKTHTKYVAFPLWLVCRQATDTYKRNKRPINQPYEQPHRGAQPHPRQRQAQVEIPTTGRARVRSSYSQYAHGPHKKRPAVLDIFAAQKPPQPRWPRHSNLKHLITRRLNKNTPPYSGSKQHAVSYLAPSHSIITVAKIGCLSLRAKKTSNRFPVALG